jgi:hypothetical protein
VIDAFLLALHQRCAWTAISFGASMIAIAASAVLARLVKHGLAWLSFD